MDNARQDPGNEMTPEDYTELKDDLWKQYRLQGADTAAQAAPDTQLGEALRTALNPPVKDKLRYGGLGALGGAALGSGAGALSHLVGTGTREGVLSAIRTPALVGALGGTMSGLNLLHHRQLQKALDEWKTDKEKTAAARWKTEMPEDLRKLYHEARGMALSRQMGISTPEKPIFDAIHQFAPGTRDFISSKIFRDPPALTRVPKSVSSTVKGMARKEVSRASTGISALEKRIRELQAGRKIPTPRVNPSVGSGAGAAGALRDFVSRNKWPLIGIGGAAGLGGLALLSSKLSRREQDKKLRGEFA